MYQNDGLDLKKVIRCSFTNNVITWDQAKILECDHIIDKQYLEKLLVKSSGVICTLHHPEHVYSLIALENSTLIEQIHRELTHKKGSESHKVADQEPTDEFIEFDITEDSIVDIVKSSEDLPVLIDSHIVEKWPNPVIQSSRPRHPSYKELSTYGVVDYFATVNYLSIQKEPKGVINGSIKILDLTEREELKEISDGSDFEEDLDRPTKIRKYNEINISGSNDVCEAFESVTDEELLNENKTLHGVIETIIRINKAPMHCTMIEKLIKSRPTITDKYQQNIKSAIYRNRRFCIKQGFVGLPNIK